MVLLKPPGRGGRAAARAPLMCQGSFARRATRGSTPGAWRVREGLLPLQGHEDVEQRGAGTSGRGRRGVAGRRFSGGAAGGPGVRGGGRRQVLEAFPPGLGVAGGGRVLVVLGGLDVIARVGGGGGGPRVVERGRQQQDDQQVGEALESHGGWPGS